MLELADSLLIAGGVVMLGAAVGDMTVDWWRRRRMARIQRVERELAETRMRLEALAFQHQAWLQAQAHEARKALILESFHASRKANAGTTDGTRSQKHNNVLRHP